MGIPGPPVQRATASPSTRTIGFAQNGQCVGIVHTTSAPVRSDGTGPITSGITSPARRTTTVSPIRTSLRATSSWLWSVALVTVAPPTNTGSRNRKGRHGTRSTDVHLDAKQAGRLLLGRKLVRDRPTGAPCREPHLCLLGQWIYLHDHAVGLIRQVVTASLGVFDVCHHLVEVHHDLRAGVDRQAVAVEPGQRRAVRLEGGAPLDEAQLIYPYGKSPGGRDRRVFLADRPRGGIPGVDEEPLTGVCLRPVEVVECG